MDGQALPPQRLDSKDEEFSRAHGARIAQARKDQGLTQQQLANQLAIPQQTLANCEVALARMPASMFPTLAQLFTPSLDELTGTQLPRRRDKRGPASRLQQQIEAIGQPPRTRQFVSPMLDTAPTQASR